MEEIKLELVGEGENPDADPEKVAAEAAHIAAELNTQLGQINEVLVEAGAKRKGDVIGGTWKMRDLGITVTHDHHQVGVVTVKADLADGEIAVGANVHDLEIVLRQVSLLAAADQSKLRVGKKELEVPVITKLALLEALGGKGGKFELEAYAGDLPGRAPETDEEQLRASFVPRG
jgi:hypothetical protein